MTAPWTCPVCRRGVHADVATCDHGGGPQIDPITMRPQIPMKPPGTGFPDMPPWRHLYDPRDTYKGTAGPDPKLWLQGMHAAGYAGSA